MMRSDDDEWVSSGRGNGIARAVKTNLPRDSFCPNLEALVGQEGVGDERHGCRPSGRWGGEVSLHSVVGAVGRIVS